MAERFEGMPRGPACCLIRDLVPTNHVALGRPRAWEWRRVRVRMQHQTRLSRFQVEFTASRSRWIVGLTVCAVVMVSPTRLVQATTPVDVLTYHNDNLRSGHNLNETFLTPANVNVTTFGKLFAYPVDGAIYGEPLYVSQLSILGKGVRNVVYVATEHDSVYAFFAGGAGLLWHRSFINPPTVTTVSTSGVGFCDDLSPEIGITGTPVIDRTTQTLYVVSVIDKQGVFFQRLHALDLATGAEKFGSPKNIAASASGSGYDSKNGLVSFNALMENQRSALLLSNGVLYIAFGSHCDTDPYHGWVLAYDALTLRQKAVFNTTPNGSEGRNLAKWQWTRHNRQRSHLCRRWGSSFEPSQQNYGDSFVKLVAGTLKVVDYFTPTDQQSLAIVNDFGTAGPLLLPPQSGPVPNELIGGGKSAILYVLNRSNMGKYCASCNPPDSQVQKVSSSELFDMFSTPAYWNGFVYQSSDNGPLLAFKLAKGKLSANPVAQTSVTFPYHGTTPVVSSNGPKNGIVWALLNGFGNGPPTVLYAYWATDLTELHDRRQVAGDAAGPGVKFTVPTVANGRVYVGTQTELDVYGILPLIFSCLSACLAR